MATNNPNRTVAAAPNREDLLQLAIAAAKRGDADSARMMFNQILADDKNNERALMWMAKLSADNRDEMAMWLNRALAVNPNNQTAKDALAKMKNKSSARDNRVLVLFGMVAGVLFILLLLVLIVLALPK